MVRKAAFSFSGREAATKTFFLQSLIAGSKCQKIMVVVLSCVYRLSMVGAANSVREECSTALVGKVLNILGAISNEADFVKLSCKL